jgi:nitrogen fixation/metabolism regulation signal transduction histidine kinase
MTQNLWMLGVITIIGLFLAAAFGNHFLVRPVSRLVTAVQRFGKGEMQTRTGLPHTSDEVGQLARAFDEMAFLVETRSVERQDVQEALRQQRDFAENLVQTGS